jgi:dienelactone hydrolase
MIGLERILGGLDRKLATTIRALRARRGAGVYAEDLLLHSTVGYEIRARIHKPASANRQLPAILMCPGIHDPGSYFSTWMAPVTAEEIARLGCLVLTFDPAGRGASWGEEDFGGPEHQDEVRVALRHLAQRPDVDPARIGIIAISLGVAMAVGGAAGSEVPISWLMDWEGPCDREIITSGGKIMAPADGHSMEDDVYWHPREAVRHVGRLRCGYLRLQAERDHAQPREKRHATRMMRAAAAGNLPWFQLNDHPRGEVPDRPVWLPSGRLAMNRTMLRKVMTLIRS